ncbi:MAG TPA: hypothetical protein VIX42_05085 [Edaphobacter sp.]
MKGVILNAAYGGFIAIGVAAEAVQSAAVEKRDTKLYFAIARTSLLPLPLLLPLSFLFVIP